MLTKVKKIIIGVAHPADASEEAQVVKEVAGELSKIWSGGGEDIEIEAKDYKDIGPAGGPPQERINREIFLKCNITVAIISRGIGEGRFEEELSLGLKRHKEEQTPFQFYIKRLLLKGEERKQREAFLARYREGCQYQDFKDTRELQGLIRQHLGAAIFRVAKRETSEAEIESKLQKAPAPQGASTPMVPQVKPKKENELPLTPDVDDLTLTKYFLRTVALLYNRRVPSEVLGNHEIHLLYTFRERVQLSSPEVKLILRTAISDIYNLKTGWYWLRVIKGVEFFISYCFDAVLTDLCEEVRLGALRILRAFWVDDFAERLSDLSRDKSISVRREAIDILKQNPSKATLGALSLFGNDEEESIKKEVFKARIRILAEINPHEAVDLILRDQEVESYFVDSSLYKKAFEAELRSLTSHKNQNIGLDACEELIARKAFSKVELEKLAQDNDWNLRYLGYRGLLDAGVEIDDSKIIEALRDKSTARFGSLTSWGRNYNEGYLLKQVYRRFKLKELEGKIEWDYYGSFVYEVIGDLYFDKKGDEIRKDLVDEFCSKRQIWIRYTAERHGVKLASLESALRDYEGFIRKGFIEAGLKVVLKSGGRSDLSLASKFVEYDEYRIQELCFNIMAQYGGNKEANVLFEYAKKLNNYKSGSLLSKAVGISSAPEALLMQALDSGKEQLVVPALSLCLRKNIRLSIGKVKRVLYSEDEKVREATVVYLIHTLSRQSLIGILKRYSGERRYFYNVVSFLDKALYLPLNLRKYFLESAKEKLLKRSSS